VRLPTIGEVVSVAQRNVERFPFVLLAGVVTAYAALSMIEGSMNDPTLVRVMASAGLGLPLMFGLTVLAERRGRGAIERFAIPGFGVAILLAFWWAWPRWPQEMQATRFAQLSAAFHLFVAFAPFIGHDEPRAFWQYNRILFIRFLLGAIYSFVLWAGLSGAFLAMDKLLGVDIASESYARLWIVIAFVFNPWFFVAGVPADIGKLEELEDYPTGLRVFTQYVLVPIVAIYLVILTIYFGKVVITREWPKGWIGNLVSSVAGGGILSWLLVHPLEQRKEHAWVKGFTRGFYIAIMPSIVMLWLAIWKRVDQYGVTEKRYFLIVLSVWLAGIALYYTFSKSRNIKVIPATLCAIALLGFAGPWGAYSISRGSQRQRLADLLAEHGLLANGELRRRTGTVSDSSAKQISEGFRYLLLVHGERSVRPWIGGEFGRGIGAVGSGNYERAEVGARAIMRALDVPYVGRYGEGLGEYFSFYAERRREAVNIEGYTRALKLSQAIIGTAPDTAGGLKVRAVTRPASLQVIRDNVTILTIPMVATLDSLEFERARQTVGRGASPERMTVKFEEGGISALVVMTSVSGKTEKGVRTLTAVDGDLYLRIP
jgi:hypothetical protein